MSVQPYLSDIFCVLDEQTEELSEVIGTHRSFGYESGSMKTPAVSDAEVQYPRKIDRKL
jgi:hypothetical protein